MTSDFNFARVLGSFSALVLAAGFAAACGSSAPSATAVSTATASVATASSSPATTQAPVATPATTPTVGALLLPADGVFESLAEFSNVTGQASFSQLSADEIAISIDLETDQPAPLGFIALLLAGTCADQTEPADFAGAVAQSETFAAGEAAQLLISTTDLAQILTAPHAILIANGPGDQNLACADLSI
jgi:hypothetical protein